MAIGSTNISMSALASEVQESTSGGISLNNQFLSFLRNRQNAGTNISFSSFANLTGIVGYATGDFSSGAPPLVKTVRQSGSVETRASFSRFITPVTSGAQAVIPTITNDGNYIALVVDAGVLATSTLELWQRSGATWTYMSSLNVTSMNAWGSIPAWDSTGTYLAIPYGQEQSATTAKYVYVAKRVGSAWGSINAVTVAASTFPSDGVMFPNFAIWSQSDALLSIFSINPSSSQNGIFRYTRSGDVLTAVALLASGAVPAAAADISGVMINPTGTQCFLSWNVTGTTPRLFTYTISGTNGTTWARVDQGSTKAVDVSSVQFTPAGTSIIGITTAQAGIQIWDLSGTTYTKGQTLTAGAPAMEAGFFHDLYYHTSSPTTTAATDPIYMFNKVEYNAGAASWQYNNPRYYGSWPGSNHNLRSATSKSTPGSH